VLKVSYLGEIHRIALADEADLASVEAAVLSSWPQTGSCTSTFASQDGSSSQILTEGNFKELVAASKTGPSGRLTLRLDIHAADKIGADATIDKSTLQSIGALLAAEFSALLKAAPTEAPEAKPSPSEQPKQPSPSEQPKRQTASSSYAEANSRSTRRRATAASASSTAPRQQWEEDKRDIDELIRELGLQEAGSAGATKRRQGKKSVRSSLEEGRRGHKQASNAEVVVAPSVIEMVRGSSDVEERHQLSHIADAEITIEDAIPAVPQDTRLVLQMQVKTAVVEDSIAAAQAEKVELEGIKTEEEVEPIVAERCMDAAMQDSVSSAHEDTKLHSTEESRMDATMRDATMRGATMRDATMRDATLRDAAMRDGISSAPQDTKLVLQVQVKSSGASRAADQQAIPVEERADQTSAEHVAEVGAEAEVVGDDANQPMTLWPATPESTPPTSPRTLPVPQLYYWVAVPALPTPMQ